ncbi:MAG: hypothetical protein K2M98_01320 [Muribaculum sp.]|nr:hypothetical protein [Muribaculum sp.]
MLTKHFSISSLILLAAAMLLTAFGVGCTSSGSTESTDPLDIAQQAIEHKDYPTAIEILDETRNCAIEGDDVSDLVRFSILYMKLADVYDSEEMVGYAYQCLSQAFITDSTATADYINTLTVEDMSQAAAVKTLLGAAGMMSFHDDSEYPDSLFLSEQENVQP